MNTEQEIEQQRLQIIEAIDWIDAERKRLSRYCFSETRKKWHGDKTRGRKITLMKKETEWLYRQRCCLRKQISSANKALRERHNAHNGTVSETFGSVFVEVARETLPQASFHAILEEVTKRYEHDEEHALSLNASTDTTATVLEKLKKNLVAYKLSNELKISPEHEGDSRESQVDFRLARVSNDNRVFQAFAR